MAVTGILGACFAATGCGWGSTRPVGGKGGGTKSKGGLFSWAAGAVPVPQGRVVEGLGKKQGIAGFAGLRVAYLSSVFCHKEIG